MLWQLISFNVYFLFRLQAPVSEHIQTLAYCPNNTARRQKHAHIHAVMPPYIAWLGWAGCEARLSNMVSGDVDPKNDYLYSIYCFDYMHIDMYMNVIHICITDCFQRILAFFD